MLLVEINCCILEIEQPFLTFLWETLNPNFISATHLTHDIFEYIWISNHNWIRTLTIGFLEFD